MHLTDLPLEPCDPDFPVEPCDPNFPVEPCDADFSAEPFNTLCGGIDCSALKVGDIFTFGNYPQGANGEVQAIEWQVLRRDDDGLLVGSKYALDCRKYNESHIRTTWSECTLRKWLNSEFIDRAFDEQERQQIKDVHLKSPNSRSDSSVPGGSDIVDRIFLLSPDEAEKLFPNSDSRKCLATAYAKKNNAWTDDHGMCYWWLRSPRYGASIAAIVNSDGDVHYNSVDDDDLAVRPALKLLS